jgi:dienelactone hydrolase
MLSRTPLWLALGFALLARASAESAAPAVSPFEPYFRPPQTDRAALSHDGRYVAFTIHQGTSLFLQVVDLDDPAKRKSIAVAEDFFAPEYSNQGASADREEKIVAKVDYLRWVTPQRLVFSCNEGRVFAINADGTNVQTIATPSDVEEDDDENFNKPGKKSRKTSLGRAPKLRQPRIVDAVDMPPGKILIAAHDKTTELFSADYMTGDLDTVDELRGRFGEKDYLFDLQGRLRMQFCSWQRPQKYQHVSIKGGTKDLDALVDKSVGLSFNVTPENYLESRSIPIGFGYDPNILYYTSNVGRDTYGIYALDLRTGKPTDLKIEHPRYDLGDPDNTYLPSILVLDRHRHSLAGVRFTGIKRATAWLDPEIGKLQKQFDQEMPYKTVEIHDWDESRTRFIITVSSNADPGTWYVADLKAGKMTELAKRAPWLTPEVRHPGGPFQFVTANGAQISGYLIMPRKKRVGRAPLVVYCREGAWGRQSPAFNPYVQAVAGMGYAVLQVNHRGCEGFGTAHRLSAHDAIDRVAAEDMIAAIDWVCQREKINPKLTAVFGFDWGGYFALRAMELFPNRIRCGVVVNPQADIAMLLNYSDEYKMRTQVYAGTFGKDRKQLNAMSVIEHVAELTQPVMIVHNRLKSQPQADALRSALAGTGNRAEILEVTNEFMRGPAATAKAFEEIQSFFNLNVYRFTTEGGEAKVVEEPKAPEPAEPAIVPDAAREQL